MKKFISEFKAFINRGNVIDMAIGVIIATAFGAITNALVNNIFMPLIGLATGGTYFTDKLNLVVVAPTYDEAGAVVDAGVTIGFGTLLSAVINFLIIAFICFMIVKAFNSAAKKAEELKKKEEEPAPEPETPAAPPAPTEAELLAEIRDLLKNRAE